MSFEWNNVYMQLFDNYKSSLSFIPSGMTHSYAQLRHVWRHFLFLILEMRLCAKKLINKIDNAEPITQLCNDSLNFENASVPLP